MPHAGVDAQSTRVFHGQHFITIIDGGAAGRCLYAMTFTAPQQSYFGHATLVSASPDKVRRSADILKAEIICAAPWRRPLRSSPAPIDRDSAASSSTIEACAPDIDAPDSPRCSAPPTRSAKPCFERPCRATSTTLDRWARPGAHARVHAISMKDMEEAHAV